MQYLYLIILLLSVGGSLHLVGRGQVRLAYDATGLQSLKDQSPITGAQFSPLGDAGVPLLSFLLVGSLM